MHEFEVSQKLQKILKKLSKKDGIRFEIVMKKINEICSSEDIEHYKNLSYVLSEFKRVHIDSSFVLIFRFDKKTKKIKFEDFQHHDKIYQVRK
ncbi:addiction module toxin RelE [Candidatus Micrarchaeota archaeon]|nr:addiction module toxin RelE [Candidatus Micrarchaeota archaeon]